MDNNNMDPTQNTIRIVLVVAILSLAGIICVALIVFGTPFANQLAKRYFDTSDTDGLVLHFNGSFNGADGERGIDTGLSFVAGHSGKGVLFNQEHSLYYLTEKNINREQGAIEFWIKPDWDGNDQQNYVFFEVGDSWFNRFRITKDGANNLRFMVWSSKVEYDAACSINSWIANDWHQIRAIWQTDSISLHIDGELCDTQRFVVMPDSLSSRLYIGSSANQDLQAQSVIDEFIIYPEP